MWYHFGPLVSLSWKSCSSRVLDERQSESVTVIRMLKIKHYKLKKAVNEDAQKDLSPLFRPHSKQKGATISYPNKILIWNNEI